MIQLKVKILYNRREKEDYYHLSLLAPKVAREALPGQFVNIWLGREDGAFLRRPFSIHRAKEGQLHILYKVVGRGTELLSQRKAGETLDIIGPLGHGFDYQLSATNYQLPILVGGGIGVAPLTFLAERLACCLRPAARIKPLVLIGAKNKKQILCAQEFRALGCQVKTATDDGSSGFKGRVTDLFSYLLSTFLNYKLSTIYACGPRPMLKELASVCGKYNIPAQISLEEHMACGINACLGCVVETKNGYSRVCKEGPVFAADDIIWR
ncbi:MAG: dihydroorotate dehydrogenase electron transfer subunit [Candidatus Omnitrophica bacterium]|nr:dihydroorotate dehydrogenase electron transfer subunit [Candidatus Omnitrophota bacterium]